MTDSSDAARACVTAYDAWAQTYDQIDNPLIAQASVVLEERARWLSSARVLDLGCGTGRNAALGLAAGATHYVGVDASAGMLEVARGRVNDERASFVEGDLLEGARRLSERGDRFDVALVCLVLEHVEDVAPIIDAAAALLDPSGRLLVLELHPSLHARGVGANFRLGDREVRLPSFRHDEDELARAIAGAGLRLVTATSHAPSPLALARSPKLVRYVSQDVLLEVVAAR